MRVGTHMCVGVDMCVLGHACVWADTCVLGHTCMPGWTHVCWDTHVCAGVDTCVLGPSYVCGEEALFNGGGGKFWFATLFVVFLLNACFLTTTNQSQQQIEIYRYTLLWNYKSLANNTAHR